MHEEDFCNILNDFYRFSSNLLEKSQMNFQKMEKSYYKKLLRKISHESNVYLKLGGNTFMGFNVLMMRKKRFEKRRYIRITD